MDFDDLRLFREILRAGSLTRAGEHLNISQPTVTRRLQRMEAELGAVLLERHGAHVRPTPEGLAFLDFSEEVLSRWEPLRQRIRLSHDVSGELRVAASSTPGGRWAAEWVAQFARAHRGVQVKLSIMDSRAVEAALSGNDCLVGFMGCLPRARHLEVVPVAEDEILLLAPSGGAWAGLPDPLPLETLAELAFVQREAGSGTLETVYDALRQAGIRDPLPVALEVDSTPALIAAVRAGVGAGFVSKNMLPRPLPPGTRTLRVANVPLRRQLVMVYDPDQVRDCPQASAFVEFVRLKVGEARRRAAPEGALRA
ncbi:MAG: LysR family transcriptional regulator [Firmicutes bacterium]|nr:LysR family transcriptional regulator [Alicyclobacillaceae bacterium]MCL6498201.1 LysR family transcriptional regulator [Bacillota bacterium]